MYLQNSQLTTTLILISNLKNLIAELPATRAYIMNTYNIFSKENESTILFHAVAENESHVKEMAANEGIDISELEIELERCGVKNEMGKPASPSLKNALIH